MTAQMLCVGIIEWLCWCWEQTLTHLHKVLIIIQYMPSSDTAAAIEGRFSLILIFSTHLKEYQNLLSSFCRSIYIIHTGQYSKPYMYWPIQMTMTRWSCRSYWSPCPPQFWPPLCKSYYPGRIIQAEKGSWCWQKGGWSSVLASFGFTLLMKFLCLLMKL
jgi:hypothetical protein